MTLTSGNRKKDNGSKKTPTTRRDMPISWSGKPRPPINLKHNITTLDVTKNRHSPW